MFQNAFLKDFVKMRQSLKPAEVSKSKPTAKPTELTLASIVENKPPAKDVLNYFRKRANEEDED